MNVEYLEIPYDEDGFVEAFSVDDDIQIIKDYFDRYGVIVFRDVVPHEQIDETIDEIWNIIEPGGVEKDDTSTWSQEYWPEEGGLALAGFLNFDADIDLPLSWKNRSHPNVHKIFTHIWGTERLWVTFDKYGVMRPTKGIEIDGEIVDRPEWKTRSNWCHWDQDPWKEPNFVRVQGVLALTDSTKTSGGFHCVPGYHKYFNQWASLHPPENGSIFSVPMDDPMRDHIQKITVRKGSFIIWDSRMPHGNYPNDDNTFRMVQYISFLPASEDQDIIERRQESLRERTQSSYRFKYLEFTELGEKIMGIKSWSQQE